MQAHTFVPQATDARFRSSVGIKQTSGVVKLRCVHLKSLLESQGDRIVSCQFVKQDGTDRKLVGRLGVRKHLKGGVNTGVAADRPYLTVFDMQLREYRNVNLDTVCEVRASGIRYALVD